MPVTYSISETSHIKVESINKAYLFRINAVAALGGLLFGFDTAVISGTIPFIQEHFNMTEVTLGWAVSSILAGCAIGAMITGKLSELLGRKITLIVSALLFTITAVGTGFAPNFDLFIFFRISGGIAVGMAAVISPMYIAEISPAHLRGRLVSLYQLAITVGILLAFISNYFLAGIGPDSWRWMFSIQALPALLFGISLSIVPESPRWLISKNRISDANILLTRIGGVKYAEKEIERISATFNENKEEVRIATLFNKKYFIPVMLGIVVAVFSQITGYNSLLYYAPLIFQNTGLQTSHALLQTLAIGIINCVFTFVGIITIDKVGRKPLLMAGSFAMGVCWLCVSAIFYFRFFDGFFLLITVLVFCAVFAASIGPVTWTYVSEIFPNKIRALGMSVATLSLWVACFITSFTFPILVRLIGETYTFIIYATLCIAYFVLVALYFPETKGKQLESLENELPDAFKKKSHDL